MGSTSCLRAELCAPSGRDLYASTVSGTLPANLYGQWSYTAPGQTAYIPSIYPQTSAVINPFWRHNYTNCPVSRYPHPYDYNGMWDGANWTWFETDRAQWYGNAVMYAGARTLIFGLSTGNGGNVPCWRNIMAGGVALRLDDPEPPTVHSVGGFPSGWVGDRTAFTVNVNASDPGLGVRNIYVNPRDALPIPYPVEQNWCPGTKTSPCPGNPVLSPGLNTTQFDEGRSTARVVAHDPTGKVSPMHTWEMHVDKTSPDITLDGQLATATREDRGDGADPSLWEDLSLPVYNLTIEASDGSNATDAQKHSGVRSIEVFIDEARVPDASWSQSCPGSSCAMSVGYQLQLHDLSAGRHVLRVIATDQVSNQLERRIEFEYIPATGIKDSYVMQFFALTEDEEDLGAPELAVNIMNGNLVYRQQDIDVTGPAADLELTRYYNTMLPPQDDTEWGDGWTLGQTPELQPEAGQRNPDEAIVVESSGAFEGSVRLPTQAGAEEFDPELQATIVKEADGGYELIDESGESATSIAFDATGQAEALRTDGYAKVDYDYEGGEIAEIAVDDPASVSDPPEPPEPSEPGPAHQFSVGESGSGDGEFSSPLSTVVDAAGNILVADTDNNRIQRFRADGTYIDSFGSYGSGDGEFIAPSDVAVDSKGNIYVADTYNARVQKFDSAGNYLDQIHGSFYQPTALAIDSSDNVLVLDAYTFLVREYDPDGYLLNQFGGSGQLYYPKDIAVDSQDNVLVTSTFFLRKYDPDGYDQGQLLLYGHDGRVVPPSGISLDAEDNIFVTDTYGDRVEMFSPEGEYLERFGESGSGEGQFDNPLGVAIDPRRDRVWVADTYNDRVQRWSLSGNITYMHAHMSEIEAQGIYLAVDSAGDILLVEEGRHRVQKFGPEGDLLDSFGSNGSGPGEFSYPTGIAVDSAGDILVVDTYNDRVQRFDSDGDYLDQFGSYGDGDGEFSYPTAIAVDSEDNVYVADTNNNRIEKFDSEGNYLAQFGSYGSGEGEFDFPHGIAIDSSDSVYVIDDSNNRIEKFDSEGNYLDLIGDGEAGSDPGQFTYPNGIAIDSSDNLLLADTGNDRIQRLSPNGDYLDDFGESGSGEEQLRLPLGVAFDSQQGRVWVADIGNQRIKSWVIGEYIAPEQTEPPEPDDPAVEIETDSGLVETVAGEEAGEHAYEHTGELLTSHEGPEGETTYDYDGSERLTGITLADGTTATIAYHSTSDRVRSVTVDLAGASAARTTYFDYTDSPRQTRVTPPDSPVTVYDIGNDGSIFRWANELRPPEIRFLAGSLYAYKETQTPISIGDHNLHVQAYSEEGIASIVFVANGDQLVDEAYYEQDPETQGIEHVREDNEWVTATESYAPGILQLEAIVTDRLGQSVSEKFRVNIPYTPPPDPEAPVRPRFAEVLKFRGDYGLDLDLEGNELAINNRIFNLIGDWHSGDPVARATTERWGVPLRGLDVAELDYRRWYITHNTQIIDQWARTNRPNEYAGYYIDHPAGGKIRLGFTVDSSANIEALRQATSTVAQDRLAPFEIPPTKALITLESHLGNVKLSLSSLPLALISAGLDIRANTLSVGASDPSLVRSELERLLGSAAPLSVTYEPSPPGEAVLRKKNHGPVHAGDYIAPDSGGYCTAGFGAFEKLPINEAPYYRSFLLTAGHCQKESLERVWRTDRDYYWHFLGRFRRNGHDNPVLGTDGLRYEVDGGAVRVFDSTLMPQSINSEERDAPIPVDGIGDAVVGDIVCHAGVRTNRRLCGEITVPPKLYRSDVQDPSVFVVNTCFDARIGRGDSGGPVWIDGWPTIAVGLATNSGGVAIAPEITSETCYPSLMPSVNVPPEAAVLTHPGMAPLQLRRNLGW